MSYEITSYVVEFYGGKDGYRDMYAQIILNNPDKIIGSVRFYPEGVEMPPDHVHEKYRIVVMHTTAEMLPSVLDVLRNEEPVFVHWNPRIKRGVVSTREEPTGEGDENFD